jgi:predicted GH43/DUF377 family glycosyl hydrolase
MHAWLQTSKIGDILNILPMLASQHRATGEAQNLILSREYAPTVLGLEYVKPIVFDGEWMDYKGALRFAKLQFINVTATQMHGVDVNFQRHCPSVFLDMWRRAGMLHHYDQLPLDIPFTKQELPAPTIFYADHSQSSPFLYREDLYQLLKTQFPDHHILRASSMRLKNIRDFLPYMAAAKAIVSVDTAFLHLSRAVDVPVIAFISSRPDPWRATPWSHKYVLHCRYDAFPTRKQEIIAALNVAVNNLSMAKPDKLPTNRPNAYNATFFRDVDNSPYWIYRYHYDGWKTRLSIDGFECEDIQFPDELADASIEDARTFKFQGKLHISYTVAIAEGGLFKCVQAYGPLELVDGAWRVTKHIVPKLPGNDYSGMQKNWVFFARAQKLFLIYGITGDKQVVHELIGDKVVNTYSMPAPIWGWGEIRGGCTVEYKGMLIRFFHSRVGQGSRHYQFRYYIGASIMELEPPFRTQMVSSFPILAGNEKYVSARTWKPNCALPYGVEVEGDRFTLVGGINDCECFQMKLGWTDLNL